MYKCLHFHKKITIEGQTRNTLVSFELNRPICILAKIKTKQQQETSTTMTATSTYVQNELSHFTKHLITIVPDAVEPKHLAVEL